MFLLNQFFKEMIPDFEIAQKLRLNIDLETLAKDLAGIVAFSSNGASLLTSKNKLTDNEAVLIWLVAYCLGYKLGLVDCESFSKEELHTKLGKSGKITSTRLGELLKNNFITKTADEKSRVTAFGIVQVQKEVFPKIKSRMSALDFFRSVSV